MAEVSVLPAPGRPAWHGRHDDEDDCPGRWRGCSTA